MVRGRLSRRLNAVGKWLQHFKQFRPLQPKSKVTGENATGLLLLAWLSRAPRAGLGEMNSEDGDFSRAI